MSPRTRCKYLHLRRSKIPIRPTKMDCAHARLDSKVRQTPQIPPEVQTSQIPPVLPFEIEIGLLEPILTPPHCCRLGQSTPFGPQRHTRDRRPSTMTIVRDKASADLRFVLRWQARRRDPLPEPTYKFDRLSPLNTKTIPNQTRRLHQSMEDKALIPIRRLFLSKSLPTKPPDGPHRKSQR